MNPLPPKPMQVDPSSPSKKNDKIEGEQSAPGGQTTPVTPSSSPTPMDVVPVPRSIAPQIEEEEKKPAEPMAREVIVPPSVSQVFEPKAAVPMSRELEEKALEPEELKAAKEYQRAKLMEVQVHQSHLYQQNRGSDTPLLSPLKKIQLNLMTLEPGACLMKNR